VNDKERTAGVGKALQAIREAEKISADMAEEARRQAADILKKGGRRARREISCSR